ncbi:MAG: hypothetical protein ACPGVU_25120, partial [Limisphaerales bacterium]
MGTENSAASTSEQRPEQINTTRTAIANDMREENAKTGIRGHRLTVAPEVGLLLGTPATRGAAHLIEAKSVVGGGVDNP